MIGFPMYNYASSTMWGFFWVDFKCHALRKCLLILSNLWCGWDPTYIEPSDRISHVQLSIQALYGAFWVNFKWHNLRMYLLFLSHLWCGWDCTCTEPSDRIFHVQLEPLASCQVQKWQKCIVHCALVLSAKCVRAWHVRTIKHTTKHHMGSPTPCTSRARCTTEHNAIRRIKLLCAMHHKGVVHCKAPCTPPNTKPYMRSNRPMHLAGASHHWEPCNTKNQDTMRHQEPNEAQLFHAPQGHRSRCKHHQSLP